MSFLAPKIFAIPPELLEESLVITAALGFPSAIAAFGRTCWQFHRLVYCSADHHLWREIFLTTFDDPRTILRCLRDATSTGHTSTGNRSHDMDISIDWGLEFMERMEAAKLFRKHTQPTTGTGVFSSIKEGIVPDFTKALKTILRILETASPFPPHHTSSDSLPNFPPIMTVHPGEPFPAEFISRNTTWLEDLLKCGYPPILVRKYLLASHGQATPLKAFEDTVWGHPEEGTLFHRLVMQAGFRPTPSSDVSGESSSTPIVTRKTIQGEADQETAAHEVARSRVYNLRYLRPERSWGPYLSVNGSAVAESILAKRRAIFPDLEQDLSRYRINGQSVLLDELDSASGSDDVDADSEGEHELGLILGRGGLDPSFMSPKPHEVVPDYTFLAAVRVLIERNLNNRTQMDEDVWDDPQAINSSMHSILPALACLDFARMGGVPGFWSKSWVMCRGGLDDAGRVPIDDGKFAWDEKVKGKVKADESEQVVGWDWAGVTGRWIRVICWLDYRDLLLHNLHGYNGDDLAETFRMFPMTLRVTGYSKPPVPKPEEIPVGEVESLVWKLPIIHIEGEATGSNSEITRKIQGTVRMLKDGAVRWSTTSSYPGEDTPEWASEGVQIGSIGSTIGMLGMWTGADQ
ncbi:hypothetical protein H0H81_010724 [Sphagnurus paluster]|uniref:F-box domain-containing protein n=1 Tax=Sphagnurus paluster TaxID=117069 RepID=A0A9P7KIH1_9AGAR|nr:hypothetical protein H0H81_010724 [Sphagnurus paluster]